MVVFDIFRSYTVHEVVQMIEDETGPFMHADVYITPPENADVSDEDSGDEDEPGVIDNLSANQLRAEAVAVIDRGSGVETVGEMIDSDESSDDEEAGPSSNQEAGPGSNQAAGPSSTQVSSELVFSLKCIM